MSAPVVLGRRQFFMRRQPHEDHAVLWVSEDGAERELINPSALSEDHTTTLDAWVPSKEGDLLAYQLSEGGNEEASLRIMDVATGEDIDGPIDRCRYSSVAWLPGGEQLFYVRRLPPDAVPDGEAAYHRRVYRHGVGEPTEKDELIYGEGRDKTAYYSVHTSRDGRWLIVTEALGTAPRSDIWIADLHGDGQLRVVQEGIDALTSAFVHRDGRLYLFTNLDAPRYRLATADPTQPEPEHWHDLLPETDAVLTDFAMTDDAVLAVRSRHAVSEVSVHDLDTGASRTSVELPGLGLASVTSRPEGGNDAWITYTDFVTPPRVLHYTVPTGELALWADPPGTVEVGDIVASQETYRSKDGTKVPMFVIRRRDIEPNGSRPTILYGYGGFNVSLDPSYSSEILAWVEAGGVYAIANLRGGSEEGESWHRAGMREHKQNVFDDFHAAAEWLIANGWSSIEHLGIEGGSNGGLLVGAAMTQRPELYAAVVCSAPLLDMVRYEQFGLGESWNDEYGRADDPNEFEWLLGYSPYHHVVEGTDYPAVLFTVFESDTRVDPLHARKLAAALQWATSASRDRRPVLIRREVNVGHGARSVTRMVELASTRCLGTSLARLRSSSRNGLVRRSLPTVVMGPCPGRTCTSSSMGRIFSAIDCISWS